MSPVLDRPGMGDGDRCTSAHADTQLVMLRPAWKPDTGLGQLSCQGLNRALALPRVLVSRYGKPGALYAPDSGAKKDDDGTPYNYLWPLATIEPTATRAGLPVDTHLAWDDMDDLEEELLSPAHDGQTLFVAWEHHVLEDLARDILKRRGDDADEVAIYVITLKKDGGVHWKTDKEGLDNQSAECPHG